MIDAKFKRIPTTISGVLLALALVILASVSLPFRLVPGFYQERPESVTEFLVQIDDGEPFPINLPTKIPELEPHTAVTLSGTVMVEPDKSLLLKTVFAPVRLYLNDELALELAQKGSYPPYMNDPPVMIATIPLTGYEGPTHVRLEYLSLTQRDVLSLPALLLGNDAAILVDHVRSGSFPFFFALILILLGLAMTLVSVTIIRPTASGAAFKWLGLFSLSAGIWVMGECDLGAFLLPYPVLLYNMAYLGLFLMTIPFLHFGLLLLNPKNKLPVQVTLVVHYLAVALAIILQLLGYVDFIKSLYWFHILAPLGFVVFAATLVWEIWRHRNPAAKRFATPVVLLAASTVLELLNYWMPITDWLTVFFQLGVLAFVISLAVAGAYYMRESIYIAMENNRLKYEMAATASQLDLQKMQYQQMAENDAAVKAQHHDLRHHFAVLQNLNEQQSHERLQSYLDSLIKKIPTDRGSRLSENYAINAVATHYQAIAQRENTQLELHFAIPQDLEASLETDLCVIIGNLLENAVEACARMVDGERFIRLHSNLEHGTLTIVAANSYGAKPRKKDGVFLSSKREGEGTGLSSIEAVTKKYGGGSRFAAKDGVFEALVYVPGVSPHNMGQKPSEGQSIASTK